MFSFEVKYLNFPTKLVQREMEMNILVSLKKNIVVESVKFLYWMCFNIQFELECVVGSVCATRRAIGVEAMGVV